MKLVLVYLYYLVLIYGRTSRLASLDDAVQTLTNHFCPRTEPFTCDGNTKGVDSSECCSGCSCHESCRLYDSCCFTNWTSVDPHPDAIVRCLPPYTKRIFESGVSYKFVVKPPPKGCRAPGSCELPEKRISWRTLDTVYSYKTKKSYVTNECAKCHGINDGLQWNSSISIKARFSYNIENMLEVLMSGDSDRLYVEFVHPLESSDRYNDICSFRVEEQCYFNSYDEGLYQDTMKQVFPNVTLPTDEEIEMMCLNGPRTNFFFGGNIYKNIFCAFCSYELPTEKCSKTSSRFGRDKSLIKMTDFKALTNVVSTTKESATEGNIPKACQNVHENETCRPVLCPHLQIRTSNGDCRFAARRWKVGGLQVALRLTTQVALRLITPHQGDIDLAQTFPNLSDSGIKQLFYNNKPWGKEW